MNVRWFSNLGLINLSTRALLLKAKYAFVWNFSGSYSSLGING